MKPLVGLMLVVLLTNQKDYELCIVVGWWVCELCEVFEYRYLSIEGDELWF